MTRDDLVSAYFSVNRAGVFLDDAEKHPTFTHYQIKAWRAGTGVFYTRKTKSAKQALSVARAAARRTYHVEVRAMWDGGRFCRTVYQQAPVILPPWAGA